MKLYELIPFVAAITNLVLSLFVFSRDHKSTLNRVYLLWGTSIFVWNLGTYLLFQVSNPEDALFFARFLQFGVIFLPVSLFHLCCLIAGISRRRLFKGLYAVAVGLALTNFTPFFIRDVKNVGYAYYSEAGPGFWLFSALYAVLTTLTIVLLYRKQKVLPPLQRKRLRLLLIANGTLILFGNNDILPILRIYHYPFTSIQIYPLGSGAAIFYGLIVGYSVLQHQLLDIYVTLSRAAAQAVRIGFVFLMGFALLLAVYQFGPNSPSFTVYFYFASGLGVLVVTTIVASIIFPRLFGAGSDSLERRILGDRFEYHDKISGFIQSVPWYSDTNVLLDDLHDLLVMTIKSRSYHLVLLDEGTRAFSLLRAHPESNRNRAVDLQHDAPVFQYFYSTRADHLSLGQGAGRLGESKMEADARTQLEPFESDVCLPFFAEQDPVGLLMLGRKQNDEPYTPHDLYLLKSLVKNLSVMINQIRLKKKIVVAEEMELLGRMSAGLAHDLNNLLTPVRTFQQFFAAGMPKSDAILELLPVAMRNLDTVQSYIREALFFSRTQSLNLIQASLEQAIQSAIKLVEPAASEKQIKVELVPPVGDSDVEMDDVLILRLIGNLLSNAIDASPAGTVVQAVLLRLPRTEISRDWYRVQVVDQGEGISKENLKRIMMPYFSTKNQGDGKRGFGLGLAIARKIVHLHHGNLYIASEERKGTTVQVDLPSKQNTQPAQLKTPAPVPG